MRIAVNCRSVLLSNRTGIGRYTYHLLDALGGIDPINGYVLYAPKRLFDVKRQIPFFPYRNFKASYDYFHGGPPAADVYHVPCPDNLVRFDGKLVATIHDLIYQTYPQGHTRQTIAMTHHFMEQTVKRADKIICASESTRRDLHAFFDFPKEKSCTILNGVDHRIFYPLQDKREALSFLKECGMEPGFILFVGTIEPRKNLPGLLEAMGRVKAEGRAPPVLVVAGMSGWMGEQTAPMVRRLGLERRVIFTGYVSDEQLNMLYNTCGVFVFPSFYEGFGFPILEAFCAGAAVVVSKTSSCLEIAGDAAPA